MKIPQVRGVEPFTKSWRDDTGTRQVSCHVTLYRQPLHRWLAARVYHWYDMRVYKLPGFKLAENLWDWWYDKRKLPLAAEQDCRCYFLHQRGRTMLATFDVPADVYEQLTGREHD